MPLKLSRVRLEFISFAKSSDKNAGASLASWKISLKETEPVADLSFSLMMSIKAPTVVCRTGAVQPYGPAQCIGPWL